MAATAASIPADNPNGTKTLLADGVIKIFINSKPAVINGLRKFRNSPFWLVILHEFLLKKFLYFLNIQSFL